MMPNPVEAETLAYLQVIFPILNIGGGEEFYGKIKVVAVSAEKESFAVEVKIRSANFKPPQAKPYLMRVNNFFI